MRLGALLACDANFALTLRIKVKVLCYLALSKVPYIEQVFVIGGTREAFLKQISV